MGRARAAVRLWGRRWRTGMGGGGAPEHTDGAVRHTGRGMSGLSLAFRMWRDPIPITARKWLSASFSRTQSHTVTHTHTHSRRLLLFGTTQKLGVLGVLYRGSLQPRTRAAYTEL
eukprot:5996371-Prymnesium_polylepis.1